MSKNKRNRIGKGTLICSTNDYKDKKFRKFEIEVIYKKSMFGNVVMYSRLLGVRKNIIIKNNQNGSN